MLLWGVTTNNRDKDDEAVYSRVYRRPISKDELSQNGRSSSLEPQNLCLGSLFLYENRTLVYNISEDDNMVLDGSV